MEYTKVSEMKYERVDKDSVINQIKDIISRVEGAADSVTLLSLRDEYNNLSNHVGTMAR